MKDKMNQTLIGKLLRGDDLVLYSRNECELILKNHKLGYIFSDLGLDMYNIMSNVSTVELDKIEDKKSLSEIVKVFISVFTNAKHVKYKDVLGDYQVFLSDDSDFVMVNEQLLNEIFGLFRKMYCVPDKEDNKYDKMIEQNSKHKELLEKFKQFEQKVSQEKKDVITFDSIVDSVSSKHNSYNLFNIWDLTVYQLMKSYARLNKIDNFNNIMLGIYTGNINTEKMKMDEINWSNRT